MKCLGCGITLQNIDANALGYTPKLDNDLCMRCFKLKHYGKLTNAGKKQDNDELVKKINNKKGHVLFLVEFLNITEEVMTLYRKISGPKTLVITKSDLLPKNIKKDRMLKKIGTIYSVKENILLVSSKTKENINVLESICTNNKMIVVAGFTNSGKSSIINTLFGSDITISKNINTTQEFIELNFDGLIVYDAPGFISKTSYINEAKTMIKPKTYQLKNKYYLSFMDINMACADDINLTIYLNNSINILKRRIKDNLKYDIEVLGNCELVIKGLGFIRFASPTKVGLNIASDYIEIRPTIIGGDINENQSYE